MIHKVTESGTREVLGRRLTLGLRAFDEGLTSLPSFSAVRDCINFFAGIPPTAGGVLGDYGSTVSPGFYFLPIFLRISLNGNRTVNGRP